MGHCPPARMGGLMQEGGAGVAAVLQPTQPVRRNRTILVYVATLLLLSWPLLVNGAPFYSEDSTSYLRGGRFGFNTGLLIVHQWWQWLVPASLPSSEGGNAKTIVANAIAQSGGTRSLIYSVVTYLLRAPGVSLLALALAQAGAVAFVVCSLRQLIIPQVGNSVQHRQFGGRRIPDVCGVVRRLRNTGHPCRSGNSWSDSANRFP